MIETTLLLPPELCATVPAPEPAPLLDEWTTLRQENAALRAQNAALQERIRELEARLGQNSANSSRPPSSDPPQTAARLKAPPSGRKRGGQPGHRGACRGLLPVEQVDEGVAVVPDRCRHVNLCSRGGCRADQQCVRARPAPGRAVAEGQFWLGQ